jgi:uncharacterized coiled-coil DUF342 family protein
MTRRFALPAAIRYKCLTMNYSTCTILAAFFVSSSLFAEPAAEKIDMEKAKAIHQRQQAGETLSAEDRAYLQRAIEQYKQASGNAGGGTVEGIDVARAKDLYEREQKGETLKPEDKAYLDKAKELHQRGGAAAAGKTADGIDMQKAKELYEKEQRGETLNAADKEYLERAKASRKGQ